MRDRVIGLEHGAEQVEHFRFGRGAETEVLADRLSENVLIAADLPS